MKWDLKLLEYLSVLLEERFLLEAGKKILCILLNDFPQCYWPKKFPSLSKNIQFLQIVSATTPCPGGIWEVGAYLRILQVAWSSTERLRNAWSINIILIKWLSHQHHKAYRWLIIFLILQRVVYETKQTSPLPFCSVIHSSEVPGGKAEGASGHRPVLLLFPTAFFIHAPSHRVPTRWGYTSVQGSRRAVVFTREESAFGL